MATILVHFAVGTLGALLITLAMGRIAGTTAFSAPFGVVFVGIASASLAHFLSPWATLAILVLYLLASIAEAVKDRRAARTTTRKSP